MNISTKICNKCKLEKPFSSFNKEKKGKYGFRPECKDCVKEYKKLNKDYYNKYRREWTYRNKEKQWNYRLINKYGINVEKYQSMLKEQDYKCKTCKITFTDKNKPNVDHCHETGKIRDLLCNKCNLILGLANDNEEILKNLSQYCKKHNLK